MTTIKTLISTVALFAASTGFAQSSNTCSWLPKGDDSQGVIGKRYAEAGFEVQDLQHTSHNAYGTGISANIPLIQGIDVGGSYQYSWYKPDPEDETIHDINAYATFYKKLDDGVKPFVSASLGYSWFKEKLADGWLFNNGSNSYSIDTATWAMAVGAEFPFKWFAVTPTISYRDDFKRSRESSQSLDYGVEASAWITSRIGASLSVSYVSWQHSSDYTWIYGTGVRVRF